MLGLRAFKGQLSGLDRVARRLRVTKEELHFAPILLPLGLMRNHIFVQFILA